jgi:hypothetical protein
MTDTDIPTAPPRWTPPVGLGTVSGYSAGVLALVGAVVDAIAGENIDADTRTLLVTGIAAVVFTSLGRMYQAGKKYAAAHGVTLPDSPFDDPSSIPAVQSGAVGSQQVPTVPPGLRS